MDKDSNNLKLLLVTANVGTIFENLNELLDLWLDEFSKKLDQLKPDFVALHMQEIGGKNYKESIQSINPFFKKFLSNPIIKTFNRYLIVVDSDFTDDQTFTSLGNVYLISERMKETDVELFDFKEKCYFNYVNRQIFTGSLNSVNLIYKERFVRNYFPEFQWSRKGFVQSKWRLKNQNYDFVNIHLFHDPSNLIALNSSPSIYSENRKRALKYSIEKIEQNHNGEGGEGLNYSIFGDFNFRLDLASLIGDFSRKSESVETKDKNNKLSRLVYKETGSHDKEIFVIEEKKFKWDLGQAIQGMKNELLKYDIELALCGVDLFELVRKFPPSYPFSEELERPHEYMESRCPSWCDRIVFNRNMKAILDTRSSNVDYSMLGENTCMGDHKPIFLFFSVNTNESPVKHQQHKQPQTSKTNRTSSSSSTHQVNNHHNHQPTRQNHHLNLSNQNMINIGMKFAYLNNALANLEKPSTDLHDQACFKNVAVVRHMDEMSTHYPHYSIANLTNPQQQQHIVVLNPWLKSIGEFLVVAHQTNLNCCSTSANSGGESSSGAAGNKQIDCECLLRAVEQTESARLLSNCLFHSSVFIRFFLQAPINGNFFKLKHLFAFLERTRDSLSKSLSTPTEFLGPIEALGEEFSRPFEPTSKSVFILSEIIRFLKTPCVYTVFKVALIEKRNAVISTQSSPTTSTVSSKEQASTSTSVEPSSANSSSSTSNNNNDENFANMNEAMMRQQLKPASVVVVGASSSGSSASGTEANAATEISVNIRTPLNGNY